MIRDGSIGNLSIERGAGFDWQIEGLTGAFLLALSQLLSKQQRRFWVLYLIRNTKPFPRQVWVWDALLHLPEEKQLVNLCSVASEMK